MANPSGTSHVYVGTAARVPGAVSGIFRQTVGSDQWERLTKGLPERTEVRAIGQELRDFRASRNQLGRGCEHCLVRSCGDL